MKVEEGKSTETVGVLLARSDYGIALALFVVAFALRVPFRSQFAYHWDSAQFVLAINEYDIRVSQPHAPGYFLYVMLGRLVNVLVGDPHASLVWMSVTFGSALVGLMYLLGTSMLGRRAGIAAALLVMTSPLFWFHSCVALTYVIDASLVCGLVLLCWQAMRRGGSWTDAVLLGVLGAVIAGVRPQTVPALLPLVLVTFWKFQKKRLLKFLTGAIVASLLVAAWVAPLLKLSGGLNAFREVVRLHAQAYTQATLAGGGWRALVGNVANATAFCWNGLLLCLLVFAAALWYRVTKMDAARCQRWNRDHAAVLGVWALWVGPLMIFGMLVAFTSQPGYVLNYVTGWLLLGAVALAQLRPRWGFVCATAAVCAFNVWVFVAWPETWDGFLRGVWHSGREIHDHDRQLSSMIHFIRSHYDPKEIVMCHSQEYLLFGLRHFQLYLPEYEQYQFVVDETVSHPPGKPMWLVRDGRIRFVDRLNVIGKKGIVLVVPPGEKVDIFSPYLSLASAKVLPQTENDLYFVPAEAVKLLR
jgi:hypothetical protein